MPRRILSTGFLVGVVCAASIASAHAATTSFSFPVSFVATDCPDPVLLTGTVHAVETTVENRNGTVLVNSIHNPQGVTGVGLVSGLIYQGTGMTKESFTIMKGETHTFVNNFRLISRGPGSDVIVQDILHVTVNANGEVTATVERSTVSCT